MDVSIIYVNTNEEEEILASLASVREWTRACTYEVIVSDNASAQGTQRMQLDAGIRLIFGSENRGFGAGCNRGVRHASGRYLLFLNPDSRFRNDVIAELVRFLDSHPLAAAAAPMLVDEHGNALPNAVQPLPTLFNEFLQHSTLTYRFPRCSWFSEQYLSGWDYSSTQEVESVNGTCLMVRAEVFRSIGGFDEAFFLYSEELDLNCRIRKAGRQVWYVHTGCVMHEQHHTTVQVLGSLSGIVLQSMRSQHYYFQKHRGKTVAFVWRHMIAALYLCRYLFGGNKMDLEYLRYVKWAVTAPPTT
jgi:GT2 family glycosyltransferase